MGPLNAMSYVRGSIETTEILCRYLACKTYLSINHVQHVMIVVIVSI